MTYVIGIDGGGTKTEAVLANIDGEIMAKAIGGPTNPNLLSKEELYQTFETLLRGIEVQAPEQYKKVGSLFAGISGAGIKQSRTDLYETILELVPDNVKVQVEADTINALYSGTYGASGIVQIAGTGSITYGINDKSEHDRVGGWGYLFGDEGSGFDIGRRGIIAVLKSEDGRGNETILVDMVFKHFTVTTARELIQKIYTSQVPKNEISPLSKIVFQAYKQRDELAIAIINEVAEEISKSIITLYEKLFNSQENTRVVLCGGVFQDREVLPQLIQQRLNNYMNITLFQPKIQPVGGSVIGAYLMDEILPTSTVIGNIIKTLKEGER